MGAVAGRRNLGLFDAGRAQNPNDSSWTAYFQYYTQDYLSGGGCWARLANTYGETAITDRFIPVDPANKKYVMSVSAKTIANNYLGNLGSGHLGFLCYDASFNFIDHHRAFSYSSSYTTLTRAATPGDTAIYIGRGDWYIGATTHLRTINFYPAGSPYTTQGGYTRFNLYNNAYSAITSVGGGEYRVDLNIAVPNWGYSLPIGTPVGTSGAGGSYNYALGAPVYPTTWTTYTSPVMTGFVIGGASSGADFRHGTRYIRFMNLMNYNYRTETAGASAKYLLDNILFLEVENAAKAEKIRTSSIHTRSRFLK